MNERYPTFRRIYNLALSSRLVESSLYPLLMFTSIAFGGILFVLLFFKGYYMMDGSFYVYAPWAVMHGKLLYKDFFYGQPPVYPYVYGIGQYILGLGYGIYSTRVISVILGIITIVLAFYIASWIGLDKRAGILTLFVLMTDPDIIKSFSSEKLFSLSGFFLTLSIFFYLVPIRMSRFLRYTIVLSILVLLFSTRLFAVSGFLFCILFLFFCERDLSFSKKLISILIALFIFLIVFLPPYIYAGKYIYNFNLWGFHTAALGRGLSGIIKSKINVPLEMIRYHWAVLLPLIVLLMVRITDRRETIIALPLKEIGFCLGLLSSILFTHFLSHWVTLDYQSYLIPGFAAIFIGLFYRRVFSRLDSKVRTIIGYSILILLPFYALGNLQRYLAGSIPAPSLIRSVGRDIKMLTKPNDKILTFSGAVLVESNRGTIHGAESFPFSYQALYSSNTCRMNVAANNEIIEESLRNKEFAALALTTSVFAIVCPFGMPTPKAVEDSIWTVINKYYYVTKRYPFSLQDKEEVLIYLPRRN